jgi:hypothetical protein
MSETTMDDNATTTSEKSWWDQLGEFFDHIGDEIIDTAQVVWEDLKSSFEEMKEKFFALFARKEMDENGRPVGEGFWGRVLAFCLSVIDFLGRVVVALAEIYLIIFIGGFILKMLATIILAAVAIAAAIFVGGLIYKAAKGIGLLMRTPNIAYYDRDRSDYIWAQYKKSWKPRYWLCWSIDDMPKWDEFWEQVDAEAERMKAWAAEEQNLWADAAAQGAAA